MIKIVILAIVAVAIAGCKPYMKFKYEMSEPGEETPEGLLAFLEKNKFPTNDVYMFSDSASYFQALRNPMFRKNLLSHMNFDRNGLLLERDTTQCQWSGYDVVRVLNPDSSYRSLTGLQLDQILQHIQPFGRTPAHDSTAARPDFTVVVTWAKFLGKYNYRLFVLSDAVRENKAARIRLVWLNVDLQRNWHVPGRQKIAIR